MGLIEGGGGGGPSPKVDYIEIIEETLIPGLKRGIKIGINTTEGTHLFLKDKYLYSVEAQLMFLGKSFYSKFYCGQSSEAQKIARKYRRYICVDYLD